MNEHVTPIIQVGVAETCIDCFVDAEQVRSQEVDISTFLFYDGTGNQIVDGTFGSPTPPAQMTLRDAVDGTLRLAAEFPIRNPDKLTEAGITEAELQTHIAALRDVKDDAAMVEALKLRFDLPDTAGAAATSDSATATSAAQLGLCCLFHAKCCKKD